MFDVYQHSRDVAVGDVELRLTDHGDEGDPVVLMVHGWPDTAQVWRHQIPILVSNGYRVLAPDMHGRGRSGRPMSLDGYKLSRTVPALLSILDSVGASRAHLVGHDFGALLSWLLAISNPERVLSLTALSVGHPAAFDRGGLRQMARSWYMLLFQFEGIAEEWLSQDDWTNLRRFVGNHPETENWIANLTPEGALEASLNWYRANMRPERLLRPTRHFPPVQVPTQGIWSTGDFALTEIQMSASGDYVDGMWRYERVDDASHWMQLDAPAQLNTLILEWIAGADPPGSLP